MTVLMLACGCVALAACASLVLPSATRDASRALVRQPALDTGGPGLRGVLLLAELQRLRAVTPYPPGVVDRFPVARLEGVSFGSVQVIVEQRAQCFWQQAWVQATQTGDAGAAATANAELHNAIDWPSNRTGRGNGRIRATDVARQSQAGQLAAFKARMASDCRAVL